MPTYEICADGKELTIRVDPEERQQLQAQCRQDRERFHSDEFLIELFESLVCNSELNWITPGDSGDLTDAPMLAILGEPERVTEPRHDTGGVYCGYYDKDGQFSHWFQPVLKRWAFMDYQLRSPQIDLADEGFAVFVGGD